MKYWRKTTKWPFIAQRWRGVRLSLPKYRNDRLKLHSDCFQPHENRQEFGHTTNKTDDLVQSIFKISFNILRALTRARWVDFAFPFQTRSKAVNATKKRGKFYTNSYSVPGHPEDNSLSRDSLKWRIWEFYRNSYSKVSWLYKSLSAIKFMKLWPHKTGIDFTISADF